MSPPQIDTDPVQQAGSPVARGNDAADQIEASSLIPESMAINGKDNAVRNAFAIQPIPTHGSNQTSPPASTVSVQPADEHVVPESADQNRSDALNPITTPLGTSSNEIKVSSAFVL